MPQGPAVTWAHQRVGEAIAMGHDALVVFVATQPKDAERQEFFAASGSAA